MASAPPMFQGDGPHVGRLPAPAGTSGPVGEGLNALSSAVAGAVEQQQSTSLEVARIERQRQLQLATGTVAAGLADLQGKLSTDLIGMREHTFPGAPGYEDQVEQRIEKFRDDASALVGDDPELQGRFIDNIATIGGDARVGEAKWAAGQRALQSVQNGSDLQSSLQSNIRTAVAAGTFSDKMLTDADALDQRYGDTQPLPGTKKQEWLRQRHDERLVTAIDARINVDPHAVMADVDAGRYGELDDKAVNQLRDRARVMADHLDVQAKQASDAALGVQRATVQNVIEDVHKGTVADMATLQSYRTLFAASQKPEDIKLTHDLDLALAQNGVNSRYDTAAPADRLAAIDAIETKPDWRKNAQLVVAHDQLQTLIARDKDAADKDPVSLYRLQTGQSVPPLNLNDPAAMRQRFVIADQASARFGKQVPMVFTDAERTDLLQQYNQANVEGKAQFIQQLGHYGSERARQMMFQIAPTKPELGRLAELAASSDPAVQSIVREAADGSAAPMKEGIAGAVHNEMLRSYGAALARLPGDRQRAIEQVSTWVYAHRAAANGKAASFDPALADQSIEAALGGTGFKGGVGRRGGAPVVLPMGSTQDDFDRVLAMGTAHPDVVRQAANGVPTWNGRALHQREFADLVPVLVHDDGVVAAYAFRSRGGSGFVKTERGQDYLLDVRGLASGLRGVASGGQGFDRQLAAHGYHRY